MGIITKIIGGAAIFAGGFFAGQTGIIVPPSELFEKDVKEQAAKEFASKGFTIVKEESSYTSRSKEMWGLGGVFSRVCYHLKEPQTNSDVTGCVVANHTPTVKKFDVEYSSRPSR